LKSLIDNLTAGRFREAILVSADGTATQKPSFGLSASAGHDSRTLIELALGD
jgi:hypothetical protein